MLKTESLMMKIVILIGTRPEAIKLSPVIRYLQKHAQDFDILPIVGITGQHRELLDQMLKVFNIKPDFDLNIMEPGQTLIGAATRIMTKLEPILLKEKPDWILVQGDTTTVAVASLAAFYSGVKVGHVEAGLRTFDKWHPFPEEINRRVAGVISDLHFAPTELARENLLREGVPSHSVIVTGNPVVDALHWALKQPTSNLVQLIAEKIESKMFDHPQKLIVVTSHRRENLGTPLEDICQALKTIASSNLGKVQIAFPVHPNPNVRETVNGVLRGIPNVVLLPPLDYISMIQLLNMAHLVLTDSGGIQEEAPALGKPVLVLRDVTERPEAIQMGGVRLVGTKQTRIVEETFKTLVELERGGHLAKPVCPYGDGRAAERIVAELVRFNSKQGSSV